MKETPVNSPSWWDGYHETTWIESGGRDQTRLFMTGLVEKLPERIANVVRDERLSIVDWGCAMGEGARVLKEAFADSVVGGLEISEAAVVAARQAHPDLWFERTDGTALPEPYNVVVTSNCLEHFRAPLAIVREHLHRCGWFYVALVPYNECPLHEQHFAQFREESFPRALAGFERLVCDVIRVPDEAWDGDQLLVVYGSPRASARLGSEGAAEVVSGDLAERLDGLRASVDLLMTERAWREEARRIWDALQREQVHCRDLVEQIQDATTIRDTLRERLDTTVEELRLERRSKLEAETRHAAQIGESARRVAELDARLADAAREAEATARAHAAHREWIESSRMLRVGRSFGRIRYVVFPKGSWRERIAWRTKLRVLSVWHRAKRLLGGGRPKPSTIPASSQLAFAGSRERSVTVVLPVYNQADLLEEAIDSVLAQEFTGFELILLNDGSTDDVQPLLARFARDPRVRVLTQENQKLPKALSNAFEFATGEFWSWTSADNQMAPAQLAQQIEFLEAHPDASMVYGDYYAIDDRGELLRDPSFRPHNRREPTSPEIHVQRSTDELNTVKDNFIGPCFMYRGAVGRILGEYDPRLGLEDYDYWMRMNHDFRIEHIGSDDLLYRYRVHDNSLSARADELGIHSAANALMAYEKERASAYRTPIRILLDTPALDAVGGELPPDVESIDPASHDVRGPAVLLTSPERVGDVAHHGVPDDVAIVAVCRADAAAAFRHRIALRRHVDHCIALDRANGEFVAVLHPSVFVSQTLATAVDAVRSAWRNDLFYRSHRLLEIRARRLPRPSFGGEPMRVLLQVDRVGSGGLERVVIMLAQQLAATQRAQVLVLVVEDAPAPRYRPLLDGLNWLDLSTTPDRRSRYREILRDERIDVVNTHYSTFGTDIAHELGIPLVQTVHNTYVWLEDAQRERIARADEHTSAYLCVSDRVAYYGWKRLALDPRKIIVQINATRPMRRTPSRDRSTVLADLGLREDRFTFLNVASVYAAKAQIVLVEALAGLRSRGHDPQLVLLGANMEPPYRELLERRARELGIGDALAFCEHTDEVEAFYRASDAFVLPSYWEGWSLAVNEAASFGLPMVLSRVGAAEEIADVARALLVDPPFGEVDALTASTLPRWVGKPDAAYVERWIAAMSKTIDSPQRARADELETLLAPANVFDSYANVLGWIAQGGSASAARPWTFATWRRVADRGSRAFARSVFNDDPNL